MNTQAADKQKMNVTTDFLKSFKPDISKESAYKPEFVAKINESRQQMKEGKVTRVKKENLSQFLGVE